MLSTVARHYLNEMTAGIPVLAPNMKAPHSAAAAHTMDGPTLDRAPTAFSTPSVTTPSSNPTSILSDEPPPPIPLPI